MILFDEIQKADPDVLFSLLQILEEGKIISFDGKDVCILSDMIQSDYCRYGGGFEFDMYSYNIIDIENKHIDSPHPLLVKWFREFECKI